MVERLVEFLRGKNLLTIVEYQDPDSINPETAEIKRECLIELQSEPILVDILQGVIKGEAFGF